MEPDTSPGRDDGKQPTAARQRRRTIPKDALWVVESREYVDLGEPLRTSLSDDPSVTDRAWDLTLETLRADATEAAERGGEPDDATKEFDDRLRTRLAKIKEEEARSPDGEQASEYGRAAMSPQPQQPFPLHARAAFAAFLRISKAAMDTVRSMRALVLKSWAERHPWRAS
jgi:hypothetical protein